MLSTEMTEISVTIIMFGKCISIGAAHTHTHMVVAAESDINVSMCESLLFLRRFCNVPLLVLGSGRLKTQIVDLEKINTNGCCLCKFETKKNKKIRLVISSKLVMARPFVFRYGQKKIFFDVFHG